MNNIAVTKACRARAFLRYGRFLLLFLPLLLAWHDASAEITWSYSASGGSETVTIDTEILRLLKPGLRISLQLSPEQIYSAEVEDIYYADNGDISWAGSLESTDLDYTFVITLGKNSVHAGITSPIGIYQLYAVNTGNGLYSGELKRFEPVSDTLPISDIVHLTDSTDEGGDANKKSDPLTVDDVSEQNFSVSQSVSSLYAPVGSDLTYNLEFENKSSESFQGIYVDVFFLLENTSLAGANDSCQILQTTDLQPVLSCDLGDFAPHEKKQLAIRVSTDRSSHPLVYSTAVVGKVRNDSIVELYRDVVTDSDGDGVSDFEEEQSGTDPLDAFSHTADDTVIDVLALYSPEVGVFYNGEVDTRVNQLIAVANKVFQDSDTGIRLRPVAVKELAYQPDPNMLLDLSHLTDKSVPVFADTDRLRQLYGADLVVLLRPGGIDAGLCGIANLGGRYTEGDFSAAYQKEFAYSVINIDCHDDSVLVHEIGHNMGLVHSRSEDPDGGTFSYSAGYGVDSKFATVMAYPGTYNVNNRIYRFSDENSYCGNYPCGASAEDPFNGASAVTSLRLVKGQVARYYPSMESRMLNLGALTDSGLPVKDTTLKAGVFSDSSSDFGQSFKNGSLVTVKAMIAPDETQVGDHFYVYVVLIVDGAGFYQIDSNGTLKSWDGDSADLMESSKMLRLNAQQSIDVIRGLDVGKLDALNKQISVFIAYKNIDTGTLYYGSRPLHFVVR